MAEKGISLVGKTALITGGGKGIGKSIAQTFAKQGARIVITARTETQLQEVARKIVSGGGKCLPIEGDVSKEEDVIRVVEASRKEFGKIDILIINAGVSIESPFMELSLSDWDHLLAVNLKGVIHCIRAVLPEMQKRKAGTIINIASASFSRRRKNYGIYSSAKAGVVNFTPSLAEEMPHHHINVLVPSRTRTKMRLNNFKN